MFNWLREILEIQHEFRERKIRVHQETKENENKCESCEVLRLALERANLEKDRLLDKLLNKPEEKPTVHIDNPIPLTRNIPWRVRQQMLEAEDREKAKLMREKTEEKPDAKAIKEFEEELNNAESARSAGATVTK